MPGTLQRHLPPAREAARPTPQAEQAAVEEWTTRLVQVSELLHGPELGLIGGPLTTLAPAGSSFDDGARPGTRRHELRRVP